MRTSRIAAPILALLTACGGGSATTPETESQSTATPDPATTGTETADTSTTAPEATSEPEEEPVDHQHANLRLLDSVASGETPFSELVDVDQKGLLVVENHDGPDGQLVQTATHFCRRPLQNRYEHLVESLRADLARGRELNDMACTVSLEGPPRMDCSMGGTEEIPTSHYIFEETEDGVRLEAIYRVSEVGKDERYVSHAFRFVDRQTNQTRRHGCR
jgi:hypothetical protein